MALFPFGATVTVLRPGGVDQFGDPSGSGTTHTVAGCALAPRTSNEDIQGRGDTVIVGLTLYAPYGSDITATDKIQIPGGLIYEVVGEPGQWLNPKTGSTPGMAVALQRVAG
jgi:hypothetical protein